MVKIATPQIKVILTDASACIMDIVTSVRGELEGIVNTIKNCINSVGPQFIENVSF